MPLKSMTGFARQEGTCGNASWAFELRSVNGRSLDLRFRLPPGYDAFEARARERVQKRFSRGSISVNLDLSRQPSAPIIRLNETVLAQVLAAAERVRAMSGAGPASVEGLLGIRGVLEMADPVETPEAQAARDAALDESFDRALDGLVAARSSEGDRLAAVLLAGLAEIEAHVGAVAASPARRPEAIARRIGEQVARILAAAGGNNGLDPVRLHQEAVLIATKADVEEELQRLRMHIAAARELMAEPGPAGRKLDFLTQELNREANTLCSKANDGDISRAGLAMKVVIDQMREQVANVE
jgi:uncharacterized protein (TIGR00255 family)